MWRRDSPRLRDGGFAAHADLGRDHDVVAAGLQRLTEQCLGLPAGVRVGGIEEIHAGIERAADELARCLRADLVNRGEVLVAGGERHRPEGEARHDETGVSERGVLHD